MNEIKNNLVVNTGFDWIRSYFHKTTLALPPGFQLVNDGNTKANDMIMVILPPIPKRNKHCGEDIILKSRWEILEKQHINRPVKDYRAIIRK
jgi:hypothetical protein